MMDLMVDLSKREDMRAAYDLIGHLLGKDANAKQETEPELVKDQEPEPIWMPPEEKNAEPEPPADTEPVEETDTEQPMEKIDATVIGSYLMDRRPQFTDEAWINTIMPALKELIKANTGKERLNDVPEEDAPALFDRIKVFIEEKLNG
jgi:hypothetical protein